jgi:hypothetical integral membrane protein (TIGR02206 family)
MTPEKNFTLFSPVHLATLAVIFLTALFYVFAARHPGSKRWVKPLSVLLAVVLLGNEIIYIAGAVIKGLWHYSWGVPLQLCDLAIFAVAYSLFRHKQWVWELAYFWGLGGTLQAVLTPDLRVTFPEYIYFKFFLTHGCILVGVIFLSAGLKRSITFHSVIRVWVITNVYAVFVALFNRLFQTNYLYLCRKPSQPSVLDYFGPWPEYILGLEFLLIASLVVYYAPYYWISRRSVNTESGKAKCVKRSVDKN